MKRPTQLLALAMVLLFGALPAVSGAAQYSLVVLAPPGVEITGGFPADLQADSDVVRESPAGGDQPPQTVSVEHVSTPDHGRRGCDVDGRHRLGRPRRWRRYEPDGCEHDHVVDPARWGGH